MNCKICNGPTRKIFDAVVLKKYAANYSICADCGFLSVDNPGWLTEAYKSPINIVDTGILQRNIWLSKKAAVIIPLFFNKKAKFLDFAGGYGLFVRLMRDKGFDFYWHDLYTANIFARGFEYKAGEKVELLTTFESFEHFPDPALELGKMLQVSRNVLFTTTLLPSPVPVPGKWWYYGLEHGQHISFYSRKSLQALAKRFGLNFYTNGRDLHLFTAKNIGNLKFYLASKIRGELVKSFLCRGMGSKMIPDMEYLSGFENFSKTFSDMNALMTDGRGLK